METAAPFNLNKALQAWREELERAPAVRSGDADELEMHLRDSVTALEGKGLAAHEAFWVARSRLGTHESLNAEFGKVNVEQVWVDRLLWMLTGSIVVGLGTSLSNGLVTSAAAGGYALTKQTLILGPFSLVLRLAVPVLLVVLFWQSGRNRDGLVWRLGRRLKAKPRTTALMTFLVTFSASAIAAGANVLLLKTMPPQTYSSLWWWNWPVGLVMPLLAPILLGWLLTRATGKKVLE